MDRATLLLRTDLWDGVTCDEFLIESPTEAEVRQAIDALDAQTRTALTLDREEASLTVGGGHGHYVVFVTVGDDQEFWNLISEPAESDVIMINIGGQEGDYPARHVVDKEHATCAAICFLKSGRRDATQTWELQA